MVHIYVQHQHFYHKILGMVPYIHRHTRYVWYVRARAHSPHISNWEARSIPVDSYLAIPTYQFQCHFQRGTQKERAGVAASFESLNIFVGGTATTTIRPYLLQLHPKTILSASASENNSAVYGTSSMVLSILLQQHWLTSVFLFGGPLRYTTRRGGK